MRFTYLFLIAGLILTSCKKNNNPAPQIKDSTFTSAAAADQAIGVVLVTYTYNHDTDHVTNALVCLNADGSIKWKNNEFYGEVFDPPGYENGVLYASATNFVWTGPPGSNESYSYGKLYAVDAANGSIKWSYLDSNLSGATPSVNKGQVYLPLHGAILGFDALSGKPNWFLGVNYGLPFPPLMDGDTLYTFTAPMSTAFYSAIAINIKTKAVMWSTPMGYNPPGNFLIAGGNLVLTTGAGTIMALDKHSGAMKWSVSDQQYDNHIAVSDNTLFAYNTNYPRTLYAFGLSTGGTVWTTQFSRSATAIYHSYFYGKNLYFYESTLDGPVLQAVDPKTGDSVSTTPVNNYYQSSKQVGNEIFAIQTDYWRGDRFVTLDKWRLVILDATTYAIKHSTEIDAEQIRSMRVIGQSGKIW